MALPAVAAELTGWPTPRVPHGGQGIPLDATDTGIREDGSKTSISLPGLVARVAGWATPAERDYRFPNLKTYEERGGGKKGEQLPNQVAHLAGWSTPTREEGHKVGDLELEIVERWRLGQTPPETFQRLRTQAHLMSGWPTPRTEDGESCGNHPEKIDSLTGATRSLAPWATPTSTSPATESYNEAGNSAGLVAIRESILASGITGSSSDPTRPASIGALNPDFVAWLMGFPKSWMRCAPQSSSKRKSK